MHSSSTRTPKLQLTAQQMLTGECWFPPKRQPTSKGKGEALARWVSSVQSLRHVQLFVTP